MQVITRAARALKKDVADAPSSKVGCMKKNRLHAKEGSVYLYTCVPAAEILPSCPRHGQLLVRSNF